MRDSERDLLATVVQQRSAREPEAEVVFVLTVTEGPEKGQTYRFRNLDSGPARVLWREPFSRSHAGWTSWNADPDIVLPVAAPAVPLCRRMPSASSSWRRSSASL